MSETVSRSAWIPGVLVATAFAFAARELAALEFFHETLHFGALLLVILLGMLWRMVLPVPGWAVPGIDMAKKPILRWAVAALGLRLGLNEILEIGGPALVVVSVSTIVAVFGGWWICRWLGIPERMGLLLGVGGAVCGASAIVAADTVVQAEKKDSALAISVITLLGTIGILIYPELGQFFGMIDFDYGVWAGASLHETAQVVAAGDSISVEAKEVATVVKLVRICWLAPIVFYLGWSLRHQHAAAGQAKVSLVPWFLVMFVVFAAVKSLNWLPTEGIFSVSSLMSGGSWLMTIGMAGVGLQTSVKDLVQAGFRPVLAGFLQWVLLAAVSFGMIRWVM